MSDRVTTVSCLMPTYNRRGFIERILYSFCKQEYPKAWRVELYVIDDGDDKVLDICEAVVDTRIRYVQPQVTKKPTLGAKLNIGIELTNSEYIVPLDDDDWHSAGRVTRHVEPMLTGDYDMTGTSTIYYHDVLADRGFIYKSKPGQWLGGLAFNVHCGSGSSLRTLVLELIPAGSEP